MTDPGKRAQAVLAQLPLTFTYSQARRAGISDHLLYRMRDSGLIENVGTGLYRRADRAGSADVDLLEIAHRAPNATICLTSALARHGLSDEIPARIDVALPRGQHRPVVEAPAVWHHFDPATFEVGRTLIKIDEETSLGLYGPARSIVDAVRLRHVEGNELGLVALRRWLRRPGSSPSELLAVASRFPRAEKTIRHALEVLL